MKILVNTAKLSTYREDNQDLVEITFGHFIPDVDFVDPGVTIVMTRKSYKYIIKKFQAFMAKQEEGFPQNQI